KSPHNRAKHASTVEGKSWNQIEQTQDDVDIAEIKQHGGRGGAGLNSYPPPHRISQGEAYSADHETGDWTGNRDQELGLGIRRFVFDLRDPAQGEQCNGTHLQSPRLGDQ